MTNPTIKEAIDWAQKELAMSFGYPEDIAFLLGERLNYSPTQLKLNRDRHLSEAELSQFKKDISKLKQNESPQYILGYSYFYGRRLKVNNHVLIPRYETEELVAFVLEDYSSQDSGKLLDIGTGSGAISLVLAQELPNQWQIVSSDISSEALKVAEYNFKANNCQVKPVLSDLFDHIEGKFDVIVSNPPYIKTTEKQVMDESVLANEPEVALFAGEDGLDFYREFAKQVDNYLNPGGAFYLEFGYEQMPQLEALFADYLPNYSITFKKDLANHPRMVRGVKQQDGNKTIN